MAPTRSGSLYHNYKGHKSIILLAVADDDYCFSYFAVGCMGSVSDGGAFRDCGLNELLFNNMLPSKGFFVGDSAFPLKTYLLKPYPTRTPIEHDVFNYRLSRARRIVENVFGILQARFRVFEKPIPFHPDKVDVIVKCCVVLHNWIRKSKVRDVFTLDREDLRNNTVTPGNWRLTQATSSFRNLPRSRNNNPTRQAQEKRDKYSRYFVGVGQVPWQYEMLGH